MKTLRKRKTPALLTATLLAVLVSLPLWAGTASASLFVTIDLVGYSLNEDGTAIVSGYAGSLSGAVTIPETVPYNGNSYSVTGIGYGAFKNCKGLTSITIPTSVTEVGNYAFSGSGLTSINIPASVTNIGDHAFSSCASLTSVEFETGIHLKTIEQYTFSFCENLNSINIPAGVATIGNNAFSESGLTSVIIPDSVTGIGGWAFYLCEDLSSVNIPSSVTSIGQYAFHDSGLTSVEFAEGSQLKTIENETFSNCSGLTSITIPASVTGIGDWVFFGSGLTSVTIPSSVTCIGHYTFYNCNSLTSVIIPASVTDIGNSAFSSCSKLNRIHYLGTLDNWDRITKQNWASPTPAVHCVPSTIYTKATPEINGGTAYRCEEAGCGWNWILSVISRPTTFTLSQTAYTYDGSVKQPAVTVKDAKGKSIAATNYTVSWSKNVNAGKAIAKVAFKSDSYEGTKTLEFTINKASIANKRLALTKTAYTYNGKVQKPTVKTVGGKALTSGTEYTIKYSNASSKTVGTYSVTVTGKGNYTGTTAKATYKINKAANPLTATGKTVKPTYNTLKIAAKNAYTVRKAQGTVTYGKASGNANILVDKKTGALTMKKALNVNKYPVGVKVTAAGNSNYKALTKTVTVTVQVIKAANSLTVKAKTATVKYTALSKKAQTVTKANAYAVSKAQGKLTYVKTSGNAGITVNKTTGNLTVKKGLKKGSYKVTVKVTAQGTSNYKAGNQTATVTIKVV